MTNNFMSHKLFLKLSLATMMLLLGGLFLHVPKALAATCSSGAAFKMVVKTDNAGASTSTQFRIPTTSTGYSYKVDINGDNDWTDVNPSGSTWNESTNRTGVVTIDFGTPGTYTIAICGTFPRIYFNNTGDTQKLLDITQWGDNAWTSMTSAFWGCSNLTGTFTDTANTSSITSLSSTFNGATNFNGNISGWNTSLVTNFGSAFLNAKAFNQPIGGWNTSSATTFFSMFGNASSFNQPLNSWNTSNVTSLGNVFSGASSFNQPLNSWNTSNVTSLTSVFSGATAFNQPVGSWDVSRVTSLANVFSGATSFNQPLNTWNTSSATTLASTFFGATSFNQPVASWDVSHVTSFRFTFNNAAAFNQNLSSWNTSGGTDMTGMFRAASAFNQPLNNWDVSYVTSLALMFSGYHVPLATLPDAIVQVVPMAFNQDLSNWNTNSVTNMTSMFGFDRDSTYNVYAILGFTNIIINDPGYTYPFNQNLSTWNVAALVDVPVTSTSAFHGASALFSRTALSQTNYDATLIGWSVQNLQPNTVLGAHGLHYCASQAARELIISKGWTIEGDNYYCDPVPGAPDTGYAVSPQSYWDNFAITLSLAAGAATVFLLILRWFVGRRF